MSRSATVPVSSRMRSASVLLPWSMCAMMLKLRMCSRGVMAGRKGSTSPGGAEPGGAATRPARVEGTTPDLKPVARRLRRPAFAERPARPAPVTPTARADSSGSRARWPPAGRVAAMTRTSTAGRPARTGRSPALVASPSWPSSAAPTPPKPTLAPTVTPEARPMRPGRYSCASTIVVLTQAFTEAETAPRAGPSARTEARQQRQRGDHHERRRQQHHAAAVAVGDPAAEQRAEGRRDQEDRRHHIGRPGSGAPRRDQEERDVRHDAGDHGAQHAVHERQTGERQPLAGPRRSEAGRPPRHRPALAGVQSAAPPAPTARAAAAGSTASSGVAVRPSGATTAVTSSGEIAKPTLPPTEKTAMPVTTRAAGGHPRPAGALGMEGGHARRWRPPPRRAPPRSCRSTPTAPSPRPPSSSPNGISQRAAGAVAEVAEDRLDRRRPRCWSPARRCRRSRTCSRAPPPGTAAAPARRRWSCRSRGGRARARAARPAPPGGSCGAPRGPPAHRRTSSTRGGRPPPASHRLTTSCRRRPGPAPAAARAHRRPVPRPARRRPARPVAGGPCS